VAGHLIIRNVLPRVFGLKTTKECLLYEVALLLFCVMLLNHLLVVGVGLNISLEALAIPTAGLVPVVVHACRGWPLSPELRALDKVLQCIHKLSVPESRPRSVRRNGGWWILQRATIARLWCVASRKCLSSWRLVHRLLVNVGGFSPTSTLTVLDQGVPQGNKECRHRGFYNPLHKLNPELLFCKVAENLGCRPVLFLYNRALIIFRSVSFHQLSLLLVIKSNSVVSQLQLANPAMWHLLDNDV